MILPLPVLLLYSYSVKKSVNDVDNRKDSNNDQVVLLLSAQFIPEFFHNPAAFRQITT